MQKEKSKKINLAFWGGWAGLNKSSFFSGLGEFKKEGMAPRLVLELHTVLVHG